MIVFAILVVFMLLVTYFKPLKKPVVIPVNEEIDIAVTLKVYIFGCVVIVLTTGLYIYFW